MNRLATQDNTSVIVVDYMTPNDSGLGSMVVRCMHREYRHQRRRVSVDTLQRIASIDRKLDVVKFGRRVARSDDHAPIRAQNLTHHISRIITRQIQRQRRVFINRPQPPLRDVLAHSLCHFG